MTDASKHPRAVFGSGGTSLKFRQVTQSDVLVVQCNASNTHGYIFANAFLNVLGSCHSICILVIKTLTVFAVYSAFALSGFSQGYSVDS